MRTSLLDSIEKLIFRDKMLSHSGCKLRFACIFSRTV